MIALKLNWIKGNAEAIVCFGLLGLLVWVGVYFIGIEKARAMLLTESGKAFGGIPRTGGVGREMGPIQQRSFLGLLINKPPSYYDSIARRNPFAPLAAFDPRKGPDTAASDLEVTSTQLLPAGQWAARIRNTRTGATYYVKEGNEIAGKFKVRKIENKKVTLITPDGEVIVLIQPAVILDFSIISGPSMSEAEEWVAEIQNNRTGEVYSVREGYEIDQMCRVKEIDRNRVVLSVQGQPDIVLLRSVGVHFAYRGSIKIGGELVAQIENLRTGKSRFVREGDIIGEVFEVKKIELNRVILSKEGEDIPLIKGES